VKVGGGYLWLILHSSDEHGQLSQWLIAATAYDNAINTDIAILSRIALYQYNRA